MAQEIEEQNRDTSARETLEKQTLEEQAATREVAERVTTERETAEKETAKRELAEKDEAAKHKDHSDRKGYKKVVHASRSKEKHKIRDFHIYPVSKKMVQTDGVRIVKIALSAFLMALSFNVFIEEAGLLPGGFNGLTKLIQRIVVMTTGQQISFALLNLSFNAIPAIVAYFMVGKKFVLFTVLNVVITSFMIDWLPTMPIAHDLILNAVFGGCVNGFAIALALNANASAGGTDFISMTIANKFNVSMWNYVLVFNAILLSISGYLFGFDKALYSVILQAITTIIINRSHKRFQRKTIFIVTDTPEPLATELMKITHHGVTSFEGIGRYSGHPRAFLYMVVSKEDIPKIKRYLRRSDQKVFMNITDSEELNGRFILEPIE